MPATNRDREMILNPGAWPVWPALPLKKANPKGILPHCGILLDEGPLASAPGYSVYTANLFNLPEGREAWDAVRYKIYPSVDALLADGWEVD